MECITHVSGRAIPVRGNDIDTDRIIPARFLRCVTFDGLGEHAFEDDRAQDPDHPFNQERYAGARILVAGHNFGCGSSREHAPQSLAKWGIRAIVAESYSAIFAGNCTNMGLPALTVGSQEREALMAAVEADPALEVAIDVASGRITAGELNCTGELPAGSRQALVEGTWNGTLVLLEAADGIDATAARLPYLNAFA